jgi:hypothetical protein
MGYIVLAAVLMAGGLAGFDEGTGVPANLKGGLFQSTLQTMWMRSPMFRRQCARIATERTLTVQLRAEGTPRPGSPRARTEFSRRHGALTRADIVISDARDRVELIAHELEHVIEQIEGVRIAEQRCAPDGFVTSVHESCRAIEVGQRIAREVQSGG